MFNTSTISKNLKIPGFAKIGSEDVLGALKVINLSAAFCRVRIWLKTRGVMKTSYLRAIMYMGGKYRMVS